MINVIEDFQALKEEHTNDHYGQSEKKHFHIFKLFILLKFWTLRNEIFSYTKFAINFARLLKQEFKFLFFNIVIAWQLAIKLLNY